MANKSPLIFVADDDEDDRLIFAQAISEISKDIKLCEAEDGNKLITRLLEADRLPDLIFLDLNMPNKNGKETLRMLRENKDWDHIPVIIYSTSTSDTDISDTYKGGASMYLEKPYSITSLVNTLKAILSTDWQAHFRLLKKSTFLMKSKK